MFFKISSAAAILLMMSSVSVAQSIQYVAPTTNQDLVPGANQSTQISDQEVPIHHLNPKGTPAKQVSNNNTQPTTTAPNNNVGANYFQGDNGYGGNCGGGCGSGCGGGCDSGCGGCNSGCGGCDTGYGGGCGAYNCCTSNCCQEYVRVFGGTNDLDNFDFAFPGAAPFEIDFREGWAFGTAFGDYINCNLRRELEFTYRHNSVDNINAGGQVVANLNGSVQAYSLMGNLVYEMKNISLGGFRPYAGGGIGLAYIDANFVSGMGTTFSISDTAFAYQGFGGLEKQIGGNARIFGEYRYFGTSDVDLESGGGSTPVDYNSQSILVGIHFTK